VSPSVFFINLGTLVSKETDPVYIYVHRSTHKKHVASDLLEQNQLTLLNIWVRLGHDSNTISQEAKYLEGNSAKKLDIHKLLKLFQLV
jgi:hypothetical protein